MTHGPVTSALLPILETRSLQGIDLPFTRKDYEKCLEILPLLESDQRCV